MNQPTIQQSIDKISRILIKSIQRDTKGLKSLGVSFSGGLDSSFLVYLVQNYTSVSNISLITTCFPGTYDVQNSKNSADFLNLETQFYLLDENLLLDGIAELSEIIGSLNPIEISYMLPLFFVCRNSQDHHILIGQGSDELFGGYHWQQEIEGEEFIRKTEETVQDLLAVVEQRENKIAEYFGKELIMPYLNSELIEYVLPLPKEYRAGLHPKYILRLVAESLNLPKEICWKKKKAAQYGSGIMKEMKKKKDSTSLAWRD